MVGRTKATLEGSNYPKGSIAAEEITSIYRSVKRIDKYGIFPIQSCKGASGSIKLQFEGELSPMLSLKDSQNKGTDADETNIWQQQKPADKWQRTGERETDGSP